MAKINTKHSIIKTLPNISGLEEIRDDLFQQKFAKKKGAFSRKTSLKSKKLTQTVPLKEVIHLEKVKKEILKQKLEGFIIPTQFLGEYLSSQVNPFKLSQNKIKVIESIAQMNNGKINEAEGYNLVYEAGKEQLPIFKPKNLIGLAPNFCSQLSSCIHFHTKSRLTLGESHLEHPTQKLPYGESILQISHLTYHALDLDLSVNLTPEDQPPAAFANQSMLHEYTFSLPYSLNNKKYSNHGYILHLEGKKITPKVIAKIIGLKSNSAGALIICSGEADGHLLNFQNKKGIFSINTNRFFSQKVSKPLKESIGTFILDKNFDSTKNGLLATEKLGKLETLNGQITLVFFPLLQNFTYEYKK
jgi:hypothetical protein